jgi:hypothetical protein
MKDDFKLSTTTKQVGGSVILTDVCKFTLEMEESKKMA